MPTSDSKSTAHAGGSADSNTKKLDVETKVAIKAINVLDAICRKGKIQPLYMQTKIVPLYTRLKTQLEAHSEDSLQKLDVEFCDDLVEKITMSYSVGGFSLEEFTNMVWPVLEHLKH